MIQLTIHMDAEHIRRRAICIRALGASRVEVGLPPAAPERSRFLLALHEHGSPVMRIPARPVLAPTLAQPETRQSVAVAMLQACAAALEGNEAGMQTALGAAGQSGVDGIHAYIDRGISPGNAPVTVSGGWIYNRVAHTGVPVKGKGFDRPLVDSGALYRSFTYQITKK